MEVGLRPAARGNGGYGLSGSPRAIDTLVDAIQRLALARTVGEIQEIVRSAARELAGSDGATFVLRDGEQCFYADEDAISPLWKGQRFPLSTCISGWTMLNRRPAVIRDIYEDDRVPHDAYRPTFVKSLAMVPIRTLDPVGAIGIYWADERDPAEEELALLRALADSTAVAMENVAVYQELEQRVRDRTGELRAANDRLELEVSRRRAELAEQQRLNKALEDFSSRAAHDLRSPLGAIQMGTETLVRTDLSDEQREVVTATLLRQSARAASLIEDLLDLARASGTARRERLVVRDLLDEVQEECPDVRLSVGSVPEAIEADPVSFKQALLNIVRNAQAYASARGEATVDVEAERDGAMAVFSLSDRGPGLPEDMQTALFQPFARGGNSGELGTGLGLAIVGAMAEAHGGRAWYEDRPGGGATFKIALADG